MFNIFNGWYNLLTNSKSELALKRAKICFKCEFKTDNAFIEEYINDKITEVKGTICGVCKCPLSAKIRSVNEKCPKQLW